MSHGTTLNQLHETRKQPFARGKLPWFSRSDEETNYLHGGLEDLESVVAAALESSFRRLPVEYLPDVVDVGSLAVQVL